MGKVSNGFGIDASEFAELLNGAFLRYRARADGRFELVYISDACEKIWGYNAHEILAKSDLLWQSVDPVNRGRLAEVLKRARRTNQSWSEEWLIRDKWGAARSRFVGSTPCRARPASPRPESQPERGG